MLSDRTLQDVDVLASLKASIDALSTSSTAGISSPGAGDEVVGSNNSSSTSLCQQYLLKFLQTRMQLQKFYRELGNFVHGTVQEYSRLFKMRMANNSARTEAREKRQQEQPTAAVSVAGAGAGAAAAAALGESDNNAASAEQALETLLVASKKRCYASCTALGKISATTARVLQELVDFHKAHAAEEPGAEAEAEAKGAVPTTTSANPDSNASASASASVSAAPHASVFANMAKPSACPELAFAYSSKLVKLNQTGPIRKVATKSFLDSLAYMKSICSEVEAVTGVCKPYFQLPIVSSCAALRIAQKKKAAADAAAAAGGGGGSGASSSSSSSSGGGGGILTWDDVLQNTLHLTSTCPHLLTRCHYVAVLHALSPDISGLLWGSMYARGLPTSLLESELMQLMWLPGNPTLTAWETLKGLMACRSKLFSVRLQGVLDLWGSVSNEAIFVDNRFNAEIGLVPARTSEQEAEQQPVQQWASLWALTYTVQVMDLYMSLVVELDLLSAEEVDYFYWYWDYLCTTGTFAWEKLRHQKLQLQHNMYEAEAAATAAAAAAGGAASEGAAGVSGGGGGGGKKGKNGKKKTAVAAGAGAGAVEAQVLPPAPVLSAPSVEELLMKGRGMMCRGLFRLSAVAVNLHPIQGQGQGQGQGALLDKTEGRYGSWAVKFQHRFQAFAELSNPSPLKYQDFVAMGSLSLPPPPGPPGAAGVTAGDGKGLPVPAQLLSLVQGAGVAFQQARAVFDEARREAAACAADVTGCGTHSASAYTLGTVVALTKVSEAEYVEMYEYIFVCVDMKMCSCENVYFTYMCYFRSSLH
jgi:uncharacterized membrane protein YgcG